MTELGTDRLTEKDLADAEIHLLCCQHHNQPKQISFCGVDVTHLPDSDQDPTCTMCWLIDTGTPYGVCPISKEYCPDD